MSCPLLPPCVLAGLLLACVYTALCTLDCTPRKRVPYERNHLKVFREEGISNYSSMLMREDLGVLMLGAREAIFALDINDISVAKAKVTWKVTQMKQNECTYKGKNPDTECRNYIRTLHQINESVMYVCGTNAFSPACDYIAYVGGQLKLKGRQEEGKGKCPFDPFQRSSSIMADGDLYSATILNFLGSEPAILRNSLTVLRTEFTSFWLNEPNFIHMDVIPESENNPEGDDDKLYIFFSENAVEYDFYSRLVVSRVARVCKGDRGGQRTLQRKWTSFLKASLDCPVSGDILPYVLQDVFLLRHSDWRKSIFYAAFTSQSGSNEVFSAVCAYSVMDINKVFSHGKYKTPVTVEASHVKWVMYNGDLPVPRPGSCINNAARASGIRSSLDLPDKTLQFVRDHPLMDDSVKPLTGQPLLVRKGVLFTRLVVDRATALDGQPHLVMFVGTDNGFMQKAVNYNGEMHIIEELQLFRSPEPISVLRVSSSTGQVYAGSASGVVQIPMADCHRYSSCLDCVLARDPYCAWDLGTHRCTPSPRFTKDDELVQSLKEGDPSRCPDPVPIRAKKKTLALGNNIRLPCVLDSSLAQVQWRLATQLLIPTSGKYSIQADGLLIYNASAADTGLYTCESVERPAGRQYRRTLAAYQLHLPSALGDDDDGDNSTYDWGGTGTEHPPSELPDVVPVTSPAWHRSGLVAMEVSVTMLSVLLVALLLWNWYKGHLPLRGRCRQHPRKQPRSAGHGHPAIYPLRQHATLDSTEEAQARQFLHAHSNYGNGLNTGVFKYIMDESEI
ncbi:semaphorin-4E [Electrophorus electricus]|uniref:semaphorin-4E n=1 Tax=Electrophorus electricus TaxID=8005 RepID=UPI0015D0CFEE|nr:semaphorin-4E [Electrophorus electricus]XP_026873906.2 semaphorin-4E [Electrophorus electricus]XP_026873907.2 semaphorin-4E [Electrophorus electricus]